MRLAELFGMEWVRTLILGAALAGAARVGALVAAKRARPENRRFWALTCRNTATAAFVMGSGLIWLAELQAVLVILGAATAGFLIGFKEQWQSLLAFWIRVVKRHYGLNDIVEVEGVKGRVVDITWLTTSIAEMGAGLDEMAYSGRMVHIPNIRMQMANLYVENVTGRIGVHTIEVPLPVGADALAVQELLNAISLEHCSPYFAMAREHMARYDGGIDLPSELPRVRLHLRPEGEVSLSLRIVVPAKDKARIEQLILQDLLKKASETIWPRGQHKTECQCRQPAPISCTGCGDRPWRERWKKSAPAR